MKKKLLLCLSFGLGVISSVQAAPNGKTTSSPGSTQLTIGSFPPKPGVYAQLSYNYVTSDKLFDANGDRKKDVDQDFEAHIANLRLLGIIDSHILGADIVATEVIIPYAIQIDNELNVGGRKFDSNIKGLNDIVITPFILQWNLGKHDQMKLTGAIGAVAPVGSYSKNESNNAGGNYFSLMTRAAFNYSFNNGIEIGMTPIFNFNNKNKDTGIKTGDELTLDFMANYKINRLQFGVSGYYYTQLNEDELNGIKINDSKTKAFGLGPAVRIPLGQSGPLLNLTWQKELYSVNKSQPNTLRVGISFKTP
ncbi:SphA family protein [Acinetobacter seifertii]|uniref:SphA family protein n=1 Tax=Acinetobacter seifertii TaxID=1530123 RepID=UPI000C1F2A2B|nr:transporter [Acinetobacter seifertii]PJF03419.1 transporter [Acinetobacter seifertii]PJG71446.1 transporter [Acinetobacter seifertii]